MNYIGGAISRSPRFHRQNGLCAFASLLAGSDVAFQKISKIGWKTKVLDPQNVQISKMLDFRFLAPWQDVNATLIV